MSEGPIGFVGLGNMGAPMAANLAASGRPIVAFDAAGTQARAPQGAACAGSAAQVAREAEVVSFCLPNGNIVRSVCDEIAETSDRRTALVLDHSTVGIEAARAAHARLEAAGVEYADAPVSGGVAGAKAATISMMFAGRAETLDRVRPVLESMAKNVFHVGDRVGQGQAMKVLNNFLSATAMAATAEAVAFGESQGLDMKTMLDVLNVSSGQNTATSDKFPKRVLTESYDAGFTSTLLGKDLRLYADGVADAGSAAPISPGVIALWEQIEHDAPGADITEIYPFVRDIDWDER